MALYLSDKLEFIDWAFRVAARLTLPLGSPILRYQVWFLLRWRTLSIKSVHAYEAFLLDSDAFRSHIGLYRVVEDLPSMRRLGIATSHHLECVKEWLATPVMQIIHQDMQIHYLQLRDICNTLRVPPSALLGDNHILSRPPSSTAAGSSRKRKRRAAL
jgi:hypothetical protein